MDSCSECGVMLTDGEIEHCFITDARTGKVGQYHICYDCCEEGHIESKTCENTECPYHVCNGKAGSRRLKD